MLLWKSVRSAGERNRRATIATSGELRLPALLVLCAPLLVGAQSAGGNTAERLLAAHNRERANAGVPALRWDPQLAAGAAQWAGRLAAGSRLTHDGAAVRSGQGENLWVGTRGRFAPEAMIDDWLREKAFYRPGRFPDVSVTGNWTDVGHYTQIVWRGSTKVGCAVVQGTAADVLVCRYRTLGNVAGQTPF